MNDKTLALSAHYLRILATVERAQLLGDTDALERLCAGVDSIEVAELAQELEQIRDLRIPDPVCFMPRRVFGSFQVW